MYVKRTASWKLFRKDFREDFGKMAILSWQYRRKWRKWWKSYVLHFKERIHSPNNFSPLRTKDHSLVTLNNFSVNAREWSYVIPNIHLTKEHKIVLCLVSGFFNWTQKANVMITRRILLTGQANSCSTCAAMFINGSIQSPFTLVVRRYLLNAVTEGILGVCVWM